MMDWWIYSVDPIPITNWQQQVFSRCVDCILLRTGTSLYIHGVLANIQSCKDVFSSLAISLDSVRSRFVECTSLIWFCACKKMLSSVIIIVVMHNNRLESTPALKMSVCIVTQLSHDCHVRLWSVSHLGNIQTGKQHGPTLKSQLM